MYVSNKRVWKSAQAVARYQQQLHQGLTPAEKRCISKTAANGTTLDIGVGTGRTTAVIGRKFKTYIGIDYSSEMINQAQRNFPDMDLRVMDARNLQFPRNSFDTILFPFNGIDCVDYDGRRKIISEVRRIIKPGGLFYYSTHNAAYFGSKPGSGHYLLTAYGSHIDGHACRIGCGIFGGKTDIPRGMLWSMTARSISACSFYTSA